MTPGSSSWGFFLTCDPEFGPQPRPPLISALKGVGGPETPPFCSCRNVSRKGPGSVYSELQDGSLLYAVRSATNQRRASGLAGCDSDRQLPLGQSPSMPGSVTYMAHIWERWSRSPRHERTRSLWPWNPSLYQNKSLCASSTFPISRSLFPQ